MTEQNSTPDRPAPKGVEDAASIDFMGFDKARDEVLLVMVEKRPWNPLGPNLFQLQEKLNAYLSFVLDGEMLEAYPQFAGKRVLIRLECVAPPGEEETAFFQHVYEQMSLQGIGFEVEVTTPTCGCGQPLADCSSAQSVSEA